MRFVTTVPTSNGECLIMKMSEEIEKDAIELLKGVDARGIDEFVWDIDQVMTTTFSDAGKAIAYKGGSAVFACGFIWVGKGPQPDEEARATRLAFKVIRRLVHAVENEINFQPSVGLVGNGVLLDAYETLSERLYVVPVALFDENVIAGKGDLSQLAA